LRACSSFPPNRTPSAPEHRAAQPAHRPWPDDPEKSGQGRSELIAHMHREPDPEGKGRDPAR
jgi:hypothetical protein